VLLRTFTFTLPYLTLCTSFAFTSSHPPHHRHPSVQKVRGTCTLGTRKEANPSTSLDRSLAVPARHIYMHIHIHLHKLAPPEREGAADGENYDHVILWGVDSSGDWALFPCLLRNAVARCRCRSHPTRQHKSFGKTKRGGARLPVRVHYFLRCICFSGEAFPGRIFPAHMSCAGTTSSDVDIVCRPSCWVAAPSLILNCPSRRCVVGRGPKLRTY